MLKDFVHNFKWLCNNTESLGKVPLCLRQGLEHCCMLCIECVQWTGGAGAACSDRNEWKGETAGVSDSEQAGSGTGKTWTARAGATWEAAQSCEYNDPPSTCPLHPVSTVIVCHWPCFSFLLTAEWHYCNLLLVWEYPSLPSSNSNVKTWFDVELLRFLTLLGKHVRLESA